MASQLNLIAPTQTSTASEGLTSSAQTPSVRSPRRRATNRSRPRQPTPSRPLSAQSCQIGREGVARARAALAAARQRVLEREGATTAGDGSADTTERTHPTAA
ncbi:MAG: hypothetical protein JJU45_00600 [Acidimicrobiia bacterium]|nr:hypothetical protein [Acidimicrobiia bacterium]